MKQCPQCRVTAFQDDCYGTHKCPNCRIEWSITAVYVGSIRTSHFRRPFSLRKLQRNPKAQRDSTLVNGQVMCACCQRPYRLDDCVDAKIESDGTKAIRVQEGWTLIRNILIPDMRERYIPKVIRGLICHDCMVGHHGREVMTADVRLKRKRSLPTEYAGSPNSDVRGGRLYSPPLDSDPTWAHTGDPAWFGGSPYKGKSRVTGLNVPIRTFEHSEVLLDGKPPRLVLIETAVTSIVQNTGLDNRGRPEHPANCCCWECQLVACGELEQARMVASITERFDLSILKGPLVYYAPVVAAPVPAVKLPDTLTAITGSMRNIARRVASLWTAFKCRHGLASGCAVCQLPPDKVYARTIRRAHARHQRREA